MAPPRPMILTRGEIWSPGVRRPAGPNQVLVLEDGLISEIGPSALIPQESPHQVVDLGGATVIPCLIDCHVHLTQAGLDLMSVDLRKARSVEEILGRLKSGSELGPVLYGWGFDPEETEEGRWPLPGEIDSLASPVFISHAEIHGSMLNRPCLELLGLGGPARVLLGPDSFRARRRLSEMIDDSFREKGLAQVARQALSRGVTTVHALEGGPLFGDRDLEFLMDEVRRLPLRALIYPQIPDPDRAFRLGLGRMGGCILLDGSPGVGTAALFDPYPGRPGREGQLYFTQSQVNCLVERAHRLGLQVSLHASGEAAIDQALRAYARVGPAFPPHRLEHFEVPAPGQARAAAEAGVVLSVQPAFDLPWSNEYLETVGSCRGRRANPLRSCLNHGTLLAGGSDAGVTPLDPLLGVQAALCHSREDERLELEEAFCLFTLWAAAAGGTHDRGRIAAGTRADLAVLDSDPRETENVADMWVLATVVAGTFRHDLPGFAGKGFQ